MEEDFKIIDGKKVTCAIIIANNSNDILAGHATGRGFDKECYDLLKGCANKNEDDFECAARELREESGIDIYKCPDFDKIQDLGIFKYNKEKRIHLYLIRLSEFPNLAKLHCDSYFQNTRGENVPEMNGYKIIKSDERHLFYKGLQFLLKNIKELN